MTIIWELAMGDDKTGIEFVRQIARSPGHDQREFALCALLNRRENNFGQYLMSKQRDGLRPYIDASQEISMAEAIEVGEELVKAAPDFSLANNNMAVAYYSNEEFDRALEYMDKAISQGFEVHPQFKEILEQHRK